MAPRWILLSLSLLAACTGEEPPVEPPVEPPTEQPAPDVQFNPAELAAAAEKVTLVPSPAEMQRALANAGLTSELASMVSDKDIGVDVENLDQVAVRTGVILAEVVLTLKDAPKEKLVPRLESLKAGFIKLGAGSDIPDTIDELITSVNNDLNREDLLDEVDLLSGAMVPELETEAGDWVVPLIQAGSWLEGAYLVSGAIESESKFEAAGSLLRQPEVVDYFLGYVQREGGDKAPDEVVKQLEATLVKLKGIASKESLSAEDVKEIHTATGAVLSML
ncbi:MAG: hypothetical protein ACI8RZ_000573 [Myxococcota bacterium]|jgi:hypothetical protein